MAEFNETDVKTNADARYDHSEKGLARRERYNAKRRESRALAVPSSNQHVVRVSDKPAPRTPFAQHYQVAEIQSKSRSIFAPAPTDLNELIANELVSNKDMMRGSLDGLAKKVNELLDQLARIPTGQPSSLRAIIRLDNLYNNITDFVMNAMLKMTAFESCAKQLAGEWGVKPPSAPPMLVIKAKKQGA